MTLLDELTDVEAAALAALESVDTLEKLGEWRSAYTGKSGAITRLSRGLGGLPAEERPEAGKRVNALRLRLEASYEVAESRLKLAAQAAELAADRIDVTMPGRIPAVGHLHLTTQVLRQVQTIFAEMGFQVWESPEVELDELNFSLLNFADDHPARDMQDTFYIEMPEARRKCCCVPILRPARSTRCAATHRNRYGCCCREKCTATSR